MIFVDNCYNFYNEIHFKNHFLSTKNAFFVFFGALLSGFRPSEEEEYRLGIGFWNQIPVDPNRCGQLWRSNVHQISNNL